MPFIADRVKESTTTTGTGAITLSGVAPLGFRTFASVMTAPTIIPYCIQNSTTGEWEVGKGTFNGILTLTRDVIRSSSNSNSLVNFSAGTKDVFISANAELIDNANTGMQYAVNRGWAMP
jgi:hypothetical protein